MTWPPIRKPDAVRASATLGDYRRVVEEFSWDAERLALSGLPRGRGLNIAHEAVDRYAAGPRRDHAALRWVDRYDDTVDFTYAELAERSNRFADLLGKLGIPRGERVFTLLGRVPELYVAVLGALKAGCVLSPLFAAYGPQPVRERLRLGEAGVLVTTPELYRRKVREIRDSVPSLREVLVTGEVSEPGTLALGPALAGSSPEYEIAAGEPDDPAFLHFTSGTTGSPKGVLQAHEAVLAQFVSARYALDLHPRDVLWCSADPGGVTGMTYAVVAPLAAGITTVSVDGGFDGRRWLSVLSTQRVSVWYTEPATLRTLMRRGAEPPAEHDLSALRFVASGGEPLGAEAVVWGQDALGTPVHDTWWQAETGAITIANFAAEEVRPGSMGLALPGVEAGLVERGEDGKVRELGREERQAGELALRRGWPSMFRGYWRDPQRYNESFSDGWYLTGDIARRDEDGYFWFVGRTGDVISANGYLVSPFEVESVLLRHPAVREAGVVGRPDPDEGELVKAFVALHAGYEPGEELRLELLSFGRRALGALAPREVAFEPRLPKTRSGKVLRRVLKARELGLAAGDPSTVEGMS
ncbi:acetate--CoA ligase [Amycolatopsis acidiphila]|uniref:acetate--CoA ligase n=1 Tax=Amycolatopsis acidiphila TaxID=715473 RepID=A0A557ZZ03_9PSEU|nr:acetate--CoA ligase [Amycolatopsis acidiphila]TVT17243.1 acetate--CoA ligase [Amycolatopsis acidiphila]UIJ62931.1 acetate--CoA ligase [Amycolatopsis acidiphila]GHG65129.1 acetyl-coenzyme A synthetase [Amycolatopsis acidiphila]